MRKLLFGILLILSLSLPVSAAEFTAPEVPLSGAENMPENSASFADGLGELLQKAIGKLTPELKAAAGDCAKLLFTALVFSLIPLLAEGAAGAASLGAAAAMGALLLQNTDALIRCAAQAIREICDYGKLLCPVLTGALAAQGGITASAALYGGTVFFLSALSAFVSRWMVPLVYLFLLFSLAYAGLGEEILKRAADAIRQLLGWLLKTMLILFTTYLGITGVVSGTTDAAALKAAKVTISSVVPVVGGILSDASESVLVSMGVLKNAAGVYGILAVLAVFLGPFVRVGAQYLMLKAAAAICSIFGSKSVTGLVEDFSTAMGLLLAMVATGSMMVLISTVCYLKGIG